MASNLVFDFRHHYVVGERRASEPSAYQFDQGHLAEIYVPENATSWEIHYAFGDFPLSEGYNVDDVEAADDGGYVITAHVPNDLFERSGELRVYLMAVEEESIITTYEGYVFIKNRNQPDDYVDDDPDNHATHLLEEAEAAAALAQEAAESIINYYPTETAQGNPATFDDGADNIPVKDLKVSIVPNQDLHGYDKPWAGGAGKNLLPLTADAIKTESGKTWTGDSVVENGVTFAITKDSAGNVTGLTANGTPITNSAQLTIARMDVSAGDYTFSGITNGSYSTFYIRYVVRTSNGTAIEINGSVFQDVTNAPITRTLPSNAAYVNAYLGIASGYTASGVVYKPMASKSTDATFAPYENICPITGMTDVEVERTGKNLFDGEWEVGSINATSGEDESNSYVRRTARIAVKSQNQYIISNWNYGDTDNGFRIYCYDASGRFLGTVSTNVAIMNNAFTTRFTTLSDTRYIRLRIPYATLGENSYQQLEEGSSNTAYEAYQGTQITISWQSSAGTVYGGNLDVTTGVLTVDMASVDLGTLNNWGYNSIYSLFTATISNSASVTSTGLRNVICDRYPTYYTGSAINLSNIPDKSIVMNTSAMSQNNKIVIIKDSTYTDVATFKTAMSGAQLVYELATPQTYQLTPAELLSVLGTNHISTDAESVEVVYRADIALYIENLTEPDADMIADTNITSGSYFMVGNTLYLATANIANGAAVVVGTNCVRSNLASALNAINA